MWKILFSIHLIERAAPSTTATCARSTKHLQILLIDMRDFILHPIYVAIPMLCPHNFLSGSSRELARSTHLYPPQPGPARPRPEAWCIGGGQTVNSDRQMSIAGRFPKIGTAAFCNFCRWPLGAWASYPATLSVPATSYVVH